MYARPTKGDLDRTLSTIMHDAHHKARAECGRITNEFAARGLGRSSSLIGTVLTSLNGIHVEAIERAIRSLPDFVERMEVPPNTVTGWARPHLVNLGNVVLAKLPHAGFSAERERIHAQYTVVFQQRLDGALRDFEVGFIGGSNISPRPQDPEQRKEVLTLKPGLWGIQIDLKEVWRRGSRWLRGSR